MAGVCKEELKFSNFAVAAGNRSLTISCHNTAPIIAEDNMRTHSSLLKVFSTFMLKSCVTTLHMRTVMLLMFSIMLATSAYAETPQNASPQTNRCNSQIHEEPTLSVTFNYIATSFPEAKTLFDKNANEINSLAQQQHITKFELQNMSYNINEINNIR